MLFKNREEAAQLLVKSLEKYKGKNPLILGIPRGAMPMARILADQLQGELNAILVHKIPSPINSEFAIGSIGYSGKIHKTQSVDLLKISNQYLQSESKKQLRMLRQRCKKYGLKAPNYKNRIVIIVDDGIATGATVLAAINEVRQHQPQKIIVAAAVAATDSAKQIRQQADELILLKEDDLFFSVSQYYENFPQVTDAEAIRLLKTTALEKSQDTVASAEL